MEQHSLADTNDTIVKTEHVQINVYALMYNPFLVLKKDEIRDERPF